MPGVGPEAAMVPQKFPDRNLRALRGGFGEHEKKDAGGGPTLRHKWARPLQTERISIEDTLTKREENPTPN